MSRSQTSVLVVLVLTMGKRMISESHKERRYGIQFCVLVHVRAYWKWIWTLHIIFYI